MPDTKNGIYCIHNTTRCPVYTEGLASCARRSGRAQHEDEMMKAQAPARTHAQARFVQTLLSDFVLIQRAGLSRLLRLRSITPATFPLLGIHV